MSVHEAVPTRILDMEGTGYRYRLEMYAGSRHDRICTLIVTEGKQLGGDDTGMTIAIFKAGSRF